MLVHFRLNVPTRKSEEIRGILLDDDRVTNVTWAEGASLKPSGDVIEADIAREAASFVLDDLHNLGLGDDGGIVMTTPLGAPFKSAETVEHAAHGDPDDAVIWRLVEDTADTASRPTMNFIAFLIIATALASIAVITDSSVLVVGAMVVGPEFAAIAALCTGIVLNNWGIARRSAWLLTWSFALAITVLTLISLIGLHTGLFTAHDVTKPRPQTGFIWQPNVWSFIVACWAGAAGVLAQAIDKTSAMVGVFISVTTVPAAGNLALGIAIWNSSEMSGSAEQLAMNIAGMLLAGVLTLLAQRVIWRRIGVDRRHRLSHRLAEAHQTH